MMLISIVGWILFGLFVGAIARYVYPGRQDLGLLQTTLLGVTGSSVGGSLSWLIVGGSAFQASGWIGSVLVLVIATRQRRFTANQDTLCRLSLAGLISAGSLCHPG